MVRRHAPQAMRVLDMQDFHALRRGAAREPANHPSTRCDAFVSHVRSTVNLTRPP